MPVKQANSKNPPVRYNSIACYPTLRARGEVAFPQGTQKQPVTVRERRADKQQGKAKEAPMGKADYADEKRTIRGPVRGERHLLITDMPQNRC